MDDKTTLNMSNIKRKKIYISLRYGRAQVYNGFTLIELLVVIAIIGLLSSVVMLSLSSARKKSRDVKRLADLKQIITALDLYYDKYGQYPSTTDSDCLGYDTSNMNSAGNPNAFINNLVTGGVVSISPSDPSKSGATCAGPSFYVYYRYDPGSPYWQAAWNAPDSNCKTAFYVLGAVGFETTTGAQPTSPGWSCPGRDWQAQLSWVTGKTE